MKEKLVRFVAISLSTLLLAASVGVIFWIARDEHGRLSEREQVALAAAAEEARQEAQLANGKVGGEDTEEMFHDIDTLISGLSVDDLPTED